MRLLKFFGLRCNLTDFACAVSNLHCSWKSVLSARFFFKWGLEKIFSYIFFGSVGFLLKLVGLLAIPTIFLCCEQPSMEWHLQMLLIVVSGET